MTTVVAPPGAVGLEDGGPPAPADEPRRRTSTFTRPDLAALLACGAGSYALVWLSFYRFGLFSGFLGFLVVWLITFLLVYGVVVRDLEDRIAATDKLMAVVVATGSSLVLLPLALIVGYVIVRGIPGLTGSFLVQDLRLTGPLDDGSSGGFGHALLGTLQQIPLTLLLSVPLALLTAVFLNEVRGPLRRPVRVFVDAMSGTPSIVAGLFIYSVWVVRLGQGFSGFAASLALSVLMLPTVTRTAEEVLRLVPDGLREASLALGAPRWKTAWSVVLPTARSGLITAVILGLARAVGETAPLIMTSFGLTTFNANPFEGPQASLSLSVFQNISSPFAAQIERSWAGALTLVTLVLVLFTIARLVGGRRPGATARRWRLRSRPTNGVAT